MIDAPHFVDIIDVETCSGNADEEKNRIAHNKARYLILHDLHCRLKLLVAKPEIDNTEFSACKNSGPKFDV